MATAAFAQNPDGSWRCTRCLTSGFSSPQGVIGHRHGKACKLGLAGVQAKVEKIAERNSSVEISSAPTAPATVQRTVQPSQQSANIPTKPIGLHPAMMGGTVRSLPFMSQYKHQDVTPPPNRSDDALEAVLALAGEVRELRQEVGVLAKSTSNHLGHAQIELAQANAGWTTTEKVVAGVAVVAVAGGILWALGAFDHQSEPRTKIASSMGSSRSSLASTMNDASALLNFVGKGASAFKSVKSLFPR